MDQLLPEIIRKEIGIRKGDSAYYRPDIASCIDIDLLRSYTKAVTIPRMIQMQKIRHLFVLGNKGSYYKHGSLWHKKLKPGLYLGQTGTWLLILCMPWETAQSYLARCGPNLESLTIRFTSEDSRVLLESLDLYNFPKLKELILSDNRDYQFEKQLEDTRLIPSNVSEKITKYPILKIDGCTKLEYLDISNTSITGISLGCDLPKLRTFVAQDTCVSDLCFLLHFPELTDLVLANCNATHIPQLSFLRQLISV